MVKFSTKYSRSSIITATASPNRVRFSIRKGEAIMVPIVVLNRLSEIWGEDSHDFKYVI